MQNLKPLASLYSWAGQFESYLVANPEDRFSRNEAHIPFGFTINELHTVATCNSIMLSQIKRSYSNILKIWVNYT